MLGELVFCLLEGKAALANDKDQGQAAVTVAASRVRPAQSLESR